MNKNSLTFNS